MRCKNCHDEVAKQEKCPTCGMLLEEDDYKICPKCHKYTEEKKICPNCGLSQNILSKEYVEYIGKGRSEKEKKQIRAMSKISLIAMIFGICFFIYIFLTIFMEFFDNFGILGWIE